MSFRVRWRLENCSSTVYACGFQLDDKKMPSNKNSKSKIKIDDTKQPSSIAVAEDYIVFQFNEDGGIDLVEDKSPDAPKHGIVMHHNHKGKKLVFDGSLESLQFKVSEDGVIISDNEGGEKRSVESSKKLPSSDVKGHGDDIKVRTEIEESTEHKPLSESTRSDSSAGSFAFPVMNLEMTGSPERMPKHNEQKKIDRVLRFPCCHF